MTTRRTAAPCDRSGGDNQSKRSSSVSYCKPDAERNRKWMARMTLFQMPSLNGAEMAVLGCLIDFARVDDGNAWPSVETVMAWTGRREKNISTRVALTQTKRADQNSRALPSREADFEPLHGRVGSTDRQGD
jgi:hypothetical protein